MYYDINDPDYRFRFAGYEDCFHNVTATKILPEVLEERAYKKVYIVSSRTLNRTTEVVRDLEKCMGDKWIGTTDKVGEHAPIGNIIEAAKIIKAAGADVILGIGGGSVIDFVRFVQLCITEEIYDKQELLQVQAEIGPTFKIKYSTTKTPKIRNIIIPTTMSTAEWTSGGTPVVEETKLKAFFIVKLGAPEVIIYDPVITQKTPLNLLLSTAMRGLDHAINTRCAVMPHPIASITAEHAIKLYIENLPRLKKNIKDEEAMTNCQFATSLCGLGNMSAVHGFSHWMGHIIGPYASVGHSDTACVLMLAQAKWNEGYADEQYNRVKELLGREEPFYQILEELLTELEMPKSFKDLGVTSKQLDEMVPFAMEHRLVTKFNLRPIDTPEKVREILALGE